jgi:hypothetical protein
MNKRYLLFKTISVTRIVCIILVAVFYLWRTNLAGGSVVNEPEGDQLIRMPGFELSLWEKSLIVIIIVAWLFNSIISLLVAFKPSGARTVTRKNKFLLIIFYAIEVITLPSFFISTYKDTRLNLFTGNHPFWVDYLWGGNERTALVSKLMVINQCLLVCCSLCFLLFFWGIFIERKKVKIGYK